MKYETFKTKCEELGKKNNVSVDVKFFDMSRYGHEDWFQAAFEVDHFGGIAAIVSYFEDNLWYESSCVGKRIFTRFDEIAEWLPYDIEREKEARENIEIPFED